MLSISTLKPEQQYNFGTILFVITVVISGILISRVDLAVVPEHIITLLPIIPAFWAMQGWIKAKQSLDEMQKSIELEAIAFSMAAAWGLFVIYGLLEIYLDYHRILLIYLSGFLDIAYRIGKRKAAKKYS